MKTHKKSPPVAVNLNQTALTVTVLQFETCLIRFADDVIVCNPNNTLHTSSLSLYWLYCISTPIVNNIFPLINSQYKSILEPMLVFLLLAAEAPHSQFSASLCYSVQPRVDITPRCVPPTPTSTPRWTPSTS